MFGFQIIQPIVFFYLIFWEQEEPNMKLWTSKHIENNQLLIKKKKTINCLYQTKFPNIFFYSIHGLVTFCTIKPKYSPQIFFHSIWTPTPTNGFTKAIKKLHPIVFSFWFSRKQTNSQKPNWFSIFGIHNPIKATTQSIQP